MGLKEYQQPINTDSSWISKDITDVIREEKNCGGLLYLISKDSSFNSSVDMWDKSDSGLYTAQTDFKDLDSIKLLYKISPSSDLTFLDEFDGFAYQMSPSGTWSQKPTKTHKKSVLTGPARIIELNSYTQF